MKRVAILVLVAVAAIAVFVWQVLLAEKDAQMLQKATYEMKLQLPVDER